jgi:hypothetical protein
MGIFRKKSNAGNDSAAIIREFNKLKDGEPLPREGACGYFYHRFTYAGETQPVKNRNNYIFFHVENDDVIQELVAGIPSWHFKNEDGRILVALIFKTGATINHIPLTLDANMNESAEILKFLSNAKKIEINLLNYIYGKIIREKTLRIPIPKNIIEEIKKAAG